MASITLRSIKGSPLTITEMDNNFTNLNIEIGTKLSSSGASPTFVNAALSGDLGVNGGDITTTATTFNLINTTATTLNIGQAATTLSIGATTGTTSIRNDVSLAKTLGVTSNAAIGGTLIVSGASTLSGTLTANGNATLGGTLTVTGNTTLTGDLEVRGGDLTTNQTTFNLINTTATTLNIGQAATNLIIGASSGTTTIRNATVAITNALTVGDGLSVVGNINTSSTTFNLINTTATTLNIGNSATTLSIGATTGTTTIRNALNITGLTSLNGGIASNLFIHGRSGADGGALILQKASTTNLTADVILDTSGNYFRFFQNDATAKGAALDLTTCTAGAGSVIVTSDNISNYNLIRATAKAYNWNGLTNNTSIEFTGIPSWVKRVTVMFSGVSTNGTSMPILKLGTSSGLVSSGYLGMVESSTGASQLGLSGYWPLFYSTVSSASHIFHGTATFMLLDNNTWTGTTQLALSSSTLGIFTTGSVNIGGTLTHINISTVGGVNTFDAGTINIMYE